MDKQFFGKTALVTGGAKRLGRAVALALADLGMNVAVHFHRSRREAEDVAQLIAEKGVRAACLEADLANSDAADQLLDRAIEKVGPIDYVINNASIFPEDSLTNFGPDRLYQNLAINAVAPTLIARRLAARGSSGAIVNFLDTRMLDNDRNHVSYHVSKRMLYTFTRLMAIEFAPAIRVNAVAPGLILAPEGKDESYLQGLASTNPLNRYGSAQDVVDATLFLLRSEFITGQVIFVDGGRHLRASVYG